MKLSIRPSVVIISDDIEICPVRYTIPRGREHLPFRAFMGRDKLDDFSTPEKPQTTENRILNQYERFDPFSSAGTCATAALSAAEVSGTIQVVGVGP